MTVVFSPSAKRDLENIGDYIARDNPRRALSFVSEIQNRCQKIATMPEAAPLREDLLPDVRMVTYGNYLILYRTDHQEVRIERILHGARDINALL